MSAVSRTAFGSLLASLYLPPWKLGCVEERVEDVLGRVRACRDVWRSVRHASKYIRTCVGVLGRVESLSRLWNSEEICGRVEKCEGLLGSV